MATTIALPGSITAVDFNSTALATLYFNGTKVWPADSASGGTTGDDDDDTGEDPAVAAARAEIDAATNTIHVQAYSATHDGTVYEDTFDVALADTVDGYTRGLNGANTNFYMYWTPDYNYFIVGKDHYGDYIYSRSAALAMTSLSGIADQETLYYAYSCSEALVTASTKWIYIYVNGVRVASTRAGLSYPRETFNVDDYQITLQWYATGDVPLLNVEASGTNCSFTGGGSDRMINAAFAAGDPMLEEYAYNYPLTIHFNKISNP